MPRAYSCYRVRTLHVDDVLYTATSVEHRSWVVVALCGEGGSRLGIVISDIVREGIIFQEDVSDKLIVKSFFLLRNYSGTPNSLSSHTGIPGSFMVYFMRRRYLCRHVSFLAMCTNSVVPGEQQQQVFIMLAFCRHETSIFERYDTICFLFSAPTQMTSACLFCWSIKINCGHLYAIGLLAHGPVSARCGLGNVSDVRYIHTCTLSWRPFDPMEGSGERQKKRPKHAGRPLRKYCLRRI